MHLDGAAPPSYLLGALETQQQRRSRARNLSTQRPTRGGEVSDSPSGMVSGSCARTERRATMRGNWEEVCPELI